MGKNKSNDTLNLHYCGISHPGLVRRINQDALLTPAGTLKLAPAAAEEEWAIRKGVCTPGPAAQIFAVCDGMGGESYGEVAADMAVTGLQTLEQDTQPEAAYGERLLQTVLATNETIYAEAERRQVARVGATFVLLWWKEGRLGLVNIGDSRGYLLREGRLTQLSRDHTQVATYVAAGLITPEQARIHPHRHRLSQYLGIETQEVGLSPYETAPEPATLQEGDRFLLCSDGLTELVTDEELEALLQEAAEAEACCRTLVRLALGRGGEDNVTVLTVFAAADPAERGN